MTESAVLEIDQLSIRFDTPSGAVYAVNGVSLELHRGSITALLGETGSGKSVTGRAMLGLIDADATVTSGRVLYRGRDVLDIKEAEANRLRGRNLAMVFQDARAVLNPLIPVGEQIARVSRYHLKLGRRDSEKRAIAVMQSVGIGDAEERLKMYPHELSGGLNQRIMLAAALVCEPDVVVADEPTTGLDVTIQAQVMATFKAQILERDRACLFITHDVGVAAEVSDRILVMYGGMIVETGPTRDVLGRPRHPYTEALFRSSLPAWEPRPIVSIPGTPHEMLVPPTLCTFLDRCPDKIDACSEVSPPWVEATLGHAALCHLLAPTVEEPHG